MLSTVLLFVEGVSHAPIKPAHRDLKVHGARHAGASTTCSPGHCYYGNVASYKEGHVILGMMKQLVYIAVLRNDNLRHVMQPEGGVTCLSVILHQVRLSTVHNLYNGGSSIVFMRCTTCIVRRE